MMHDYPETMFGGDFPDATDYLDPYIREQLQTGGNWAIYPPNPYGPKTLNYFANEPNPARAVGADTCWAPTTAAATCWRG